MAWAFAKLDMWPQPLMDALAAQSIAIISDFIPQNIGNLAWSYAHCRKTNAPLMHAMAAAS